jgi:thiamine biosynthesis lipoprotein
VHTYISDAGRPRRRARQDSLVSRIAAAPDGGAFTFPTDSIALFDLYDRLFTATGGAVDPLVGRQLELLGYDARYSLRPAPEPERARWRANWVDDVSRDGTTLRTRRPLVIDVGAVGKGYLVDIVATMLRDADVGEFVVDASGDLRHSGEQATRVGLAHPYDSRLVIGVAEVRDQALCASGTTERAWGDGLHHLLDARTGCPVDDVLATWVVADTAAVADGLATALFVTAPRQLAPSFRFSCVRLRTDGRAEISPDFTGEIFQQEGQE